MSVTVLRGDCREVLLTLPAESVHCVVTSPPYWGLRDYGVAGQLGLESDFNAYIAGMVAVFREVRRVLRSDGTLWLNLGDSYANYRVNQKGAAPAQTVHNGEMRGKPAYNSGGLTDDDPYRLGNPRRSNKQPGLKEKDLCGIPWRVAFALQADGWWLRQDIIWSKPNPMPESVTDRCTKAHEFVFLLAKGQWKSRIVKFSDLQGERLHFGQHCDFEKSGLWEAGTQFCVSLATTIFDTAKRQYQLGLPPFYSQEWKQLPDGGNSVFVCGLPKEHRATVWAARLLCAEASPKEFVSQINRLSIALTESNDLLVGGGDAKGFDAPFVYADGKASVTVHDAGKVGKFEFDHNHIVVSKPTTCKYYYDAEAIAEAVSPNTHARLAQDVETQIGSARAHAGGKTNGNMKAVFNHKMAAAGSRIKNNESFASAVSLRVDRRNKRSVWEVATAPFSEAHFATFPPALVEPCIKAGTSEKGCCAKCGAPWVRETERSAMVIDRSDRVHDKGHTRSSGTMLEPSSSRTTGWLSSCSCNADVVACTVLDPFGGAGTTGLVADRLQRSAILIELNSQYADMAEERINGDAPLAGLWSAGDQVGVAEAAAQHQAEFGVD